MKAPDSRVVSTTEARRLIGCGRTKLYRLTLGTTPPVLRSVRVDGRRWIDRGSLDAYLKARKLAVAEMRAR